MAKFEPGVSGNPTGRPKGSRNRQNQEDREKIRQFVMDHWDDLTDSFSEMEAKDKGRLINSFIRHFLPPPFDPSRLSVEQLEEVYDYFKNRNDEEE